MQAEEADTHRIEQAVVGGTGPDDDEYLTPQDNTSVDADPADPEDFTPGRCAVCNTEIPPTQDRCPEHRERTSPTSATATYDRDVATVAIAVVEGNSDYHALAMAQSAADYVEGTEPLADEAELLYNCTEYEYTTKTNWILDDSLPELTQLDAEVEATLVTNCWDSLSAGDSETPLIVDEDHTELTSATALEAKQEAATDPLWVVPIICYDIERNLEGETVRERPCPACEERTEHVHEHTKAHRPDPEDRAYWTCLACGDSHRDLPPKTGEFELQHYQGYDRYPEIDGEGETLQRQQFELVMQRIEESDALSLDPE